MKKKFALSFVALASVALLAACMEKWSGAKYKLLVTVEEKRQLKTGFFEESGSLAAYGTAEQKGAQLAVDEINAAQVVSMENKSK